MNIQTVTKRFVTKATLAIGAALLTMAALTPLTTTATTVSQAYPPPATTPVPPSPVEKALKQAQVASDKRDFEGALAILNKALETNPESTDLLLQRGFVYYRLRKPAEGDQDMQRVIALPANTPHELYVRAQAYNEMGEGRKAYDDVSAALEVEPKSVDYLVLRSGLYMYNRQFDEALADVDLALKYEPKSFKALFRKGHIYLRMGQFAQGIPFFTKAIAVNKNSSAAYNNRAWSYANIGKADPAIKDCLMAVKLQPDSPAILDTCGFAYYVKGNYAKSIEYYDAGINLAPGASMATSYCRRGQAHQKAKNNDKAIADYKTCLELVKAPDLVKVANDGLAALGAQ
jgi:tetratricopeptide (TPR) repeat protein